MIPADLNGLGSFIPRKTAEHVLKFYLDNTEAASMTNGVILRAFSYGVTHPRLVDVRLSPEGGEKWLKCARKLYSLKRNALARAFSAGYLLRNDVKFPLTSYPRIHARSSPVTTLNTLEEVLLTYPPVAKYELSLLLMVKGLSAKLSKIPSFCSYKTPGGVVTWNRARRIEEVAFQLFAILYKDNNIQISATLLQIFFRLFSLTINRRQRKYFLVRGFCRPLTKFLTKSGNSEVQGLINSMLLRLLLLLPFTLGASTSRRRSGEAVVQLSSASTSSSLSGSVEELRQPYSSSSDSDDLDNRCCCFAGDSEEEAGCQRLLKARTNPVKTGIVMIANAAFTAAFSAALILIDSNVNRYCGNHATTRLVECYPNVKNHLLGTVWGLEPFHLGLDIAAFVYVILHAMFGQRNSSPDHWDGLLFSLAILTLLGRLIGTFITVFTLPGDVNDYTYAPSFRESMKTASGTFMGLEMSYLLILIIFCLRDINRYGQYKKLW